LFSFLKKKSSEIRPRWEETSSEIIKKLHASENIYKVSVTDMPENCELRKHKFQKLDSTICAIISVRLNSHLLILKLDQRHENAIALFLFWEWVIHNLRPLVC
jgi:hypothetical protein